MESMRRKSASGLDDPLGAKLFAAVFANQENRELGPGQLEAVGDPRVVGRLPQHDLGQIALSGIGIASVQ